MILLVRQGQGWGHRDAVAGMDAHGVHVLDGADDDAIVGMIAHHLHLVFFPAQHRFFDQYLVGRRGIQAADNNGLKFIPVIGDAAARAAQGKGWPDNRRQADLFQRCPGLRHVMGDAGLGSFKADAGHGAAKQAAVLSHVDGIGLGADQLDPEFFQGAVFVQRHRRVQGRLSTHGGQDSVGAFFGDDLADDFRRDGFHIGRFGKIRVGHDSGRVGID